MSGSFETFTEYRSAINSALEQTLEAFPSLLGGELSEPALDAVAKLREYSLRDGKRLRGSLAAAAYDQASGTHLGKPGIQLGVALELMQNYLLIVDDVMDKSALRRGKPTIHELYLQQAQPQLDLHEAQMMAVNVGQLAQHMASLVVLAIEVKPQKLQQTSTLMHRNIVITGIGQIDDLYQQIGREVSVADIMRKYEAKSSYYTFINPLQCGFALAGKATTEVLAQCHAFGIPAGVAFQLHDDYLGVFGDAETLGKPNLDDIREGKYTLLMQYALQNGEPAQHDLLQAVLGKPDADEADLAQVREVLEASGAKAFVEQETARYADEARSILRSADWESEFTGALEQLIGYSISRKS